ncbi:MAG: flagellar biosynthetic protein FliO [Gammaproteobacteria bacterium]|nr:flagellar biosynthetic protein FliO [Gammaproteobacteria bacterium]
MKFLAATTCLIAIPHLALAQSAENPLSYQVLLRMSGGLLLVVALVFAAAWGVRRFGRLPTAGSGTLQLLGGIAVGQRERVVLIKAGNERLLLGVAPGRVQMLHTLAGDGEMHEAFESADADEQNDSPGPSGVEDSFHLKLRGLLKRGGVR